MRTDLILGTAGHIDHGKTALVRALTGVDTDRLPEERARGISIDLGFAALRGPDGVTLGVVDVPGHEAFVRTMVAGATGFDLVLLCVAADEGVMPQTREHLAVLELLRVPRLLVVLTRADRAEEGMADLVEEEIREWLADSRHAGAPVVRTSAVTGDGIEQLRERIFEVAAKLPESQGGEHPTFLPVDRAFTARGTGTVVTGTLRSGELRRGDELVIHPGGAPLRVRTLQRHGIEVDRARAGSRVAVALVGRGGGVPAIGRGAALAGGAANAGGAGWRGTHRLLLEALPLPAHSGALVPGARVRILLGTGEVLGTLRRVRGSGAFRAELETTVVARGGERCVIRSLTPVETIGGGVVLHPSPSARVRGEEAEALAMAFRETEPLARLVAGVSAAGWKGVPASELAVRFGIPQPSADHLAAVPEVAVLGDRLFPADRVRTLEGEVEGAVDFLHRESPEEVGLLPDRMRSSEGWGAAPEALRSAVVKELARRGALAWFEGKLCRPDHVARLPERLERTESAVRIALSEAGFEGREEGALLDACGVLPEALGAVLRHLEREGWAIQVEEGRWLDSGRAVEAQERIAAAFPPGNPFSPADVRGCLGLSRRLLLPLMERWDREGFTERVGDRRVVRERESP